MRGVKRRRSIERESRLLQLDNFYFVSCVLSIYNCFTNFLNSSTSSQQFKLFPLLSFKHWITEFLDWESLSSISTLKNCEFDSKILVNLSIFALVSLTSSVKLSSSLLSESFKVPWKFWIVSDSNFLSSEVTLSWIYFSVYWARE